MFTEVKMKRVALRMIDLVHSLDAAMKVSSGYYRNSVSGGRTEEATGHIKRAAMLPYRMEARIGAAVTTHGANAINTVLASVSGLQLFDLQAEINRLKLYSDTLKDNFQNQGWTEEMVADDIEAERLDLDTDEFIQIPVGYEDDI